MVWKSKVIICFPLLFRMEVRMATRGCLLSEVPDPVTQKFNLEKDTVEADRSVVTPQTARWSTPPAVRE